MPDQLTNLFQHGIFTLSAGGTSDFKFECDALTSADWDCIAVLARRLAGSFSHVHGIPRGGLQLAERLTPHIDPDANRLLIVDDVFTTGRSMEKARMEWPARGVPVTGVVLFSRGPHPTWVKVILDLHKDLK